MPSAWLAVDGERQELSPRVSRTTARHCSEKGQGLTHVCVAFSAREPEQKPKQAVLSVGSGTVESSGFCGAAPALAPLAGAEDSWAPLLAKPFATASLSPGASLAEVCFMALKNAKLVFVFLAILNRNF